MEIASLIRDERATTDGVWITPNLAEKGRFLVRASSPKFRLRRDQLIRRLTRQHREWEAAPLDLRCREQAKILFEELIVDVDGFTNQGVPVTRDQYLALASTALGEPALDLAFAAVDMATARRESDGDDAVGNSSTSSAPAQEGMTTGSSPTSSPEATPPS